MPIVDKINALEDETRKLSDEELRNKTDEFKKQLSEGKTLDDILPEAFAVVREASRRVLGMRHFDVQLIGGIILHQGRIAEMKTGEGKTLVATLPAYLNALSGEGVHVITVNDYLAKRDSEWMGKVYRFLGLTVGLIINGMNPKQKQDAYNFFMMVFGCIQQAIDIIASCIEYKCTPYIRYPVSLHYVNLLSENIIDKEFMSKLCFKMNIAFAVHQLCDKDKLASVGFERFLEKQQQYDFDKKLLHALSMHGINEENFENRIVPQIVTDELEKFYSTLLVSE